MPYWIRRIKYFIQRGRRGWADEDVWSFDNYLCRVIIGGLDHLKKHKMGCPSEFWDSTRVNDECWKWNECLEEMRQAFMMIEKDSGMNFMFKRDENGNKTIDRKRFEQDEAKVQRGLELFTKHFRNLWD